MYTLHSTGSLGMSVLCSIFKICGQYTHKICGGNMRKSLSYIPVFHGVSLVSVSCRRHWPPPTTLAPTTLLAHCELGWYVNWASFWRQLGGIFLLLPVLMSACQFYAVFLKYADSIHTKYAAETCGSH